MMELKDEDILKLRPDFFPEKFYKNVVGKEIPSAYQNLGVELDIDSETINALRGDMPPGVFGNLETVTNKVLYKYRKMGNNTVRDLYSYLKDNHGRVADNLLLAARKFIDDKGLQGNVTVTDGLDGKIVTLPDVPRDNVEEIDSRNGHAVTPAQPTSEPFGDGATAAPPAAGTVAPHTATVPVSVNDVAATPAPPGVVVPPSAPPTAVVAPMETSPAEGSTSAGDAPGRPELFRLQSDEDLL